MKTRVFVPILLSSLLVACSSNDMSDLRAFVEEVKQRPPGRIEPLPEIKEVETHTYLSASLRNPFAPEQAEETQSSTVASNGLMPDFNRRKEELEAFPLDSLRMVGTLGQGESTWGLIKTNDGTIYRVKPGNHMGQNYGRIDRIFEEKVELTEIIQDGQGGYIERQATLALGEE
ncbi:MAG: pilus assembly protein PilP [Chromatiales bacterium]|jgi:type IV pilus assembly protein PilP